MSDPYVWPGTECLENKLGIRDAEELASIEARLVSIRDVEVATTTIPGAYNLKHLQKFHKKLFGDVYAWAGEVRTVDISKEESRFCHWRYVDEQINSVLSRLEAVDYLLSLTFPAFVNELAFYYGELNAVHPFREGNGRSVRAFLRQLTAAAGFQLDWSALSVDDNVRACSENLRTGDVTLLVQVLTPLVGRM